MTSSSNINHVKNFWQLLSEKNYLEAFDCLHQDFVWWLGLAEAVPGLTNPTDKAGLMAMFVGEKKPFPTGLRITVKNIWQADANTVIAEGSSQGVLANGEEYCNVYVWILELKDGKIIEMREYADTAYGFNKFS